MNSILRIINLKKSYGQTKVLRGINFEISKGEIKCIIGPSGSGKTTLLRCLALLEDFDEGEIIYHNSDKIISSSEDREKVKIRKKIGIVFQDFNLWPHKSVLENIVDPLVLVKKMTKKEAAIKAVEMLKKVDLSDKLDAFPDFLSGGQRQRVAIARTLAMNPEIIICDEITSSLDPELISGILKLLKRLAVEERQTMIIVTHHLEFASEIADEILFMDEGIIIENGTPDKIFRSPTNLKTKNFLKTLKKHSQEINVYEGLENFRAFNIGFMKKIKSSGDYLVLGAAKEDWWHTMGDTQHEWHKIRKNKQIKLKMILYELVESEKRNLEMMPELTEYRLIPQDVEVPANVNIYDDTILILIFGKKPTVIEIKNEKLAKSYFNYFNILWKQGSPINL